MISNKAKYILTLFAYLPLFAVITIRNLDFLQSLFLSYLKIDIQKFCLFVGILIFFILTYYLFKCLVRKILNKVESTAPRDIEVEIKSEKNTEMLGFLLTYIVPFSITFENGLYDLFAFCLLFILLLHVYIKTSLFCINPLLNYSFGYNIYEIEMHSMNGFLLTTRKHRNVNKLIKVYKVTDDLWKEQ